MSRFRAFTTVSALLVACNMDGDVQQQGSYAFLPGSPVPDTVSRPLRKLLIIEEDGPSATRLYYYFEGDLGRLGLGIESLPRVLFRGGNFSFAFDLPASTYTGVSNDAGAGGSDGGSSDARGLLLDVNGAEVPLTGLVAADLVRTGAARFLTALESGRYGVRAFFGVETDIASLRRIILPDDGAIPNDPLEFTTELGPAEVSLSLDEGRLRVDPGALARPDYLIADLFQNISRISSPREFEAVLRISIAPTTTYVATPAVLASALAGLCWSVDKPLFARMTQVARAYQANADGDAALIHRRSDASEVPASLWTFQVTPGAAANFCTDFR